MSDIEAEIISLNRDDKFVDGIFFETFDGGPIVLGFTEKCFQVDAPFILHTLNVKFLAKLTTNGNLAIFRKSKGFIEHESMHDLVNDLTGNSLNFVDSGVEDIINDIFEDLIEVLDGLECMLGVLDEMLDNLEECSLDPSNLDLICIINVIEEGTDQIDGCF